MEKIADYQPIENYSVIGDLNTVALVGLNGSIDFMCFPDFDSPTIFAALLDKQKGGFFRIAPLSESKAVKQKQMYLPDTNVLLTRFLQKDGVGELTDFMPVESLDIGKELIRSVSCIHGHLDFTMECCPRFDYARADHSIKRQSEKEIVFISDGKQKTVLRLIASIPIEINETDAQASFTLNTGDKATFMLEYVAGKGDREIDLNVFAEESLFETINFWKDWISKSRYRGRWMEVVNRSALVLKLKISEKYGSIVAAPTFGLPEEIGGIRNWDYRYTWIRDASFTIYTLLKLGYKKEAREFINWIEKQCNDIGDAGSLRLMYTIDGRKELAEVELNHLEGYQKSQPIRIGNGAYDQIQLDIYGELLDAVFLYDKYAEPISYEFWLNISRQVNWVCDHWKLEDEGIWEVRGGKREFLYSRLMCWVALDRGMKLADAHSYPLPLRWRNERDEIFGSIHKEFWNPDLKCFVQYKGSETVDAATLLMPLIR